MFFSPVLPPTPTTSPRGFTTEPCGHHMWITKSWIYLHLSNNNQMKKTPAWLSLGLDYLPLHGRHYFFPPPSLPFLRLSQHDWSWAGEGDQHAWAGFSVLNNSARLFTCSLLTLKQHPPVTLPLNMLMIMSSASPLALPSITQLY